MTRFARAKGSKASNERIPEEATSWTEMKQQLETKNKEIEDNKKRQEIHNQRNASYKAFLEEREENESKKTTWADFPGSAKSVKQIKKRVNNMAKVSRNNNNNFDNKDSSEDEAFALLRTKVDNVLNDINKSNSNSNVRDVSAKGENLLENGIIDPVIQVKKSKQKKLKEKDADESTFSRVYIKNSKQKKLKEKIDSDSDAPPENLLETTMIDPAIHVKKSKQKKQKGNKLEKDPKKSTFSIEIEKIDSDSDAPPEEETAKKEVVKPVVRTKKAKQKKQKIIVHLNSEAKEMENEEITNKPKNKRKLAEEEAIDDDKLKKLKTENKDGISNDKIVRNKGNQVRKIIKENLTERDLRKIEKKKQKRWKQVLKKKRVKAELRLKKREINETEESTPNTMKDEGFNDNRSFNNSETNKRHNISKGKFEERVNFNTKAKEKVKDKEISRKKPLLPHKMFINGKQLEIEYVDGFPIKKEDAERIQKLRREMISKGLPRSEINVALKLERRKAEKAFTREKKKVCFNCRKSGHNLSECPELNKDQVAHTAGSGICFKCGSTEHTHFECKVVRGQEFKFAQCFICNEQGHIARQCPDNARGLYPKGGACNVCGDVTHLKKDCPQYQAQQQRRESNLKIETFGDSNPDNLEENYGSNFKKIDKRPNKIIKF